MNLLKGPRRLAQSDSGAPQSLREAFRTAQDCLGTPEQVAGVAERLGPLLAVPPTSVPPGPVLPPGPPVSPGLGAKLLGAKLLGAKTLVSLAALAALTGVLWWMHPPQPSDRPAAVSQGSPAATDKADKGEPGTAAIQPQPQPLLPAELPPLSDTLDKEREPGDVPMDRAHPQRRRRGKNGKPVHRNPEAELRILQRAQDMLAARPVTALAITDQHLREYPSGLFAQEREMIAIEALWQLGREQEMAQRARLFLERFARSTHAPRVRSLLKEVVAE